MGDLSNSLLPKDVTQFADEDFWDNFFKARGKKAFEWYGDYPELAGVLNKYLKQERNILMVGCGNSTLSDDLYDHGFVNISNIDISETAIKQMREKNAEKRPKMTYTKMDATKMTYEDESFKTVVDKGTLDALLPDMDHRDTAVAMIEEVWRVVNSMGTYTIITLAQNHVVKTLVDTFKGRPCIFRVEKVGADDDYKSGKFMMPVFCVAIIKLKASPGLTTMWESKMYGKAIPHQNSEDLLMAVKEFQYIGFLQDRLSKGCQLKDGDQPCVKLCSPDQPEIPRYTMYVVDSPDAGKKFSVEKKFGVFLVPQGREKDTCLFTKEGRSELVLQSNYQRLLIVYMSRGLVYQGFAEIKAELSPVVMRFSPARSVQKFVPFLSTNYGIGIRDIIYQTTSTKLGQLCVEDVYDEANVISRQTLFGPDTAPEVISTATLVFRRSKLKGKRKLGPKKKTHVKCQLDSAVERMVAAVVCRCARVGPQLENLLVVGLKCGTLATFLTEYIKDVGFKQISAIEEDNAMVSVAKEAYSLHKDISVTSGAPLDDLIKGLQDRDYGRLILNDVHSNMVDICLPLVKKDGLLIVITSSDNIPTIRSKVDSDFTHCKLLNIDSSCVLIGSNTELPSVSKKVTELEKTVTARMDEEQADCKEDLSLNKFADTLSSLTAQLSLPNGKTA